MWHDPWLLIGRGPHQHVPTGFTGQLVNKVITHGDSEWPRHVDGDCHKDEYRCQVCSHLKTRPAHGVEVAPWD